MGKLLSAKKDKKILYIVAMGNWTLHEITRDIQKDLAKEQEKIFAFLQEDSIQEIHFQYDNKKDNEWGTLLLSVFCSIKEESIKRKIAFDISLLPMKMQKLMALDYNDPLSHIELKRNFFYKIGEFSERRFLQLKAAMDFVGSATIAFGNFFRGKAAATSKDIWQEIYNAGAASLPIISLVSILLGLILAFVSAIQLQVLGAEIYVSSLVSVSMVRVMSPVLTGIVIAGRIGASYAATIGSMQVNEEVDAIETFGMNPIEFLVLPRILSLSLMMPFLTVYSDFMGILGGYIVISFGYDISFYAFVDNIQNFAKMEHIWIGLFHSFVFGIIIALTGCYQGIASGRDAEAVGRATTMAVVHSIIGIIVSTSIITIILSAYKM